MPRVVLVTGVSRDLGARFARTLAKDDQYTVVGIDVAPPRHDLGNVTFLRADIRNPWTRSSIWRWWPRPWVPTAGRR